MTGGPRHQTFPDAEAHAAASALIEDLRDWTVDADHWQRVRESLHRVRDAVAARDRVAFREAVAATERLGPWRATRAGAPLSPDLPPPPEVRLLTVQVLQETTPITPGAADADE